MAIMSIVLALLALLIIGPYLVPLGSAGDVAYARDLARPHASFISVPYPGTEGILFHYERHAYTGELTDPPVFILLHGFAANLRSWDEVKAELAAHGEVIAYDRIPFGLSGRLLDHQFGTDNPYTRQAAVVQLNTLLDHWNVQQAVFVGNSAGGAVAMEFALRHPGRAQALILLSPAVYRGDLSPLATAARFPPLQRLGLLVSRKLAKRTRLLDIAYHDPERITEQKRENAALTARVRDWDLALLEFVRGSAQDEMDLSDHLDQLALPVLLLTGDDDRVIPTRQTVRLAGDLPEATLYILESCGHLPQDECPAQFIKHATAWLPSIPR